MGVGAHACNSSIHDTEMGDFTFDISLGYTVRLCLDLKKNQVKRIKCMHTLDKLRIAILSVLLVDFSVCAHTPVLLAPDQDAENTCCPACTPASSIG